MAGDRKEAEMRASLQRWPFTGAWTILCLGGALAVEMFRLLA